MLANEAELEERRDVFTDLIAATIRHCETEVRQMDSMVKQLEKNTRQKLVDTYGQERAWRGLASDDFLRMVDKLHQLGQWVYK